MLLVLRFASPLNRELGDLVVTWIGALLLAASPPLFVAHLRVERAWWRAERAAQERQPIPGRRRRRPFARDAAFWMNKLSERLRRLGSLESLGADSFIIESEKRLVRDAIAKLPPANALAVMAAFPQIVRRLDPFRRALLPQDEKPS